MTKDNTGIKSILSIHTPRRVVVAKKPRPTVQEMLDHEDLMNIYDPFWHIPDPLDTPEDTSKATPKREKKERTDKIYRHSEMMRYLTRPKDKFTPEEKKKIVKDFYKKAEEPKKKPMSIIRYINKINSLYNNSEETPENKYPVKPTERFNDRIQEQDRKQKARNITTREKTDGQI